ncbi:MAG: thiol-disulfide oxidoreductase DCC family protein [Methyloligellaceae bacterium]
MMDALTVYFDGGCPLCLKEIDFYRRRQGAERIGWIDLSIIETEEVIPGLSKTDALARFHVKTPAGQLLSGARAFAAMWAVLPSTRLLGRIAAAPGLVQLFEVFYRLFLKVRPLWRPKRCDADVCETPRS